MGSQKIFIFKGGCFIRGGAREGGGPLCILLHRKGQLGDEGMFTQGEWRAYFKHIGVTQWVGAVHLWWGNQENWAI